MLNVSHVHFVPQQTIRELFDMNDGEKREVAMELSVPQAEEEEAVNKQSTTILEQVSCIINMIYVAFSTSQSFFNQCDSVPDCL